MMRGKWPVVLLMLGVAVAALGLSRLRFDPDVLGMLPPEMPEVRGLKAYHDAFAKQDELVVLLEMSGDDEDSAHDAAEDLARRLVDEGLAKRARFQPQWDEGDQGLTELLAYLWLNGPEETAATLGQRFSEGRAEKEFAAAVERVATAMEGQEMVMRAHDPIGFLRHPSLNPLMKDAGEGGGFASADGRAHLLLVDAPRPLPGYKEAGEWLGGIRESVARWKSETGSNLGVHLTGEPAFAAEIGGAMENDMRGTVGITATLIGLLFWIVHRRLALLGGLTGVLSLVFLTAMGLAGWIYGELSIMAAGFAAILIGLAVDYAVLVCQEAKLANGDRRTLSKATTKSIAWAAATTAVVFLALNFSGLPGIAQLGTVVACGIGAGAVLILGIYLPFVAKLGAPPTASRGEARFAPTRRTLTASAALSLLAVGLLLSLGFPGVEFDTRMMRPRDSLAMDAFERVQRHFPQWDSDELQVVIEASDDETMQRRIAEARHRLDGAETRASGVELPADWWPHAGRQRKNAVALGELTSNAEHLLAAAGEAGFTDEGLALNKAVLEEIGRLARLPAPAFPESPSAREIMRKYLFRDNSGGGVLVGTLKPADGIDPAGKDYTDFRGLSGDGIWLTGWDLLRPAVVPLIRRDLTHVFLPMAVLMIAMLGVIFRSPRDVLKILLSMALSGLLLLAIMRLCGIGWNFLNIAATPLLLGTGIDYGIHVMLSLRRSHGDIRAMWQGTGKAVVFCGCSTAIGFGSLCFASNDAMSSLGSVAVIGILCSMVVSVFLLPGWNRRAA